MSHLQLRATDGHSFSSYLARPEGLARGGIVVVQEIFGVTGHIERVAEQFAAEGYLAIAPALFDRQERGVNLAYDTAGVAHGFALASAADENGLMADLVATIAAVAHAGAVGMIGYCWGGRVVYQAGSRTNIAAGVVYYGGGIPQVVEPTPRCPMQFHFGEQDTHIPLRDVEKIRDAFPQGEYHTYAAGHGFNCAERASYDAAAAHLAFVRVKEFFGRHLG
ncbi:MAG: dienelactone hydrolase family protein [Gammaproteobacteria bacterium]|nr:dienelactone hydrolase family protein [Gammaproteobacteria bacterium]MDH5271631.1 dienelactone hydrolase family protein [Gammaproteobacteria bacterium]